MVFEEEAEVIKSDSAYDNVKYCEKCGKEWSLDKDICCKESGFFAEEFNRAAKKYIELYKTGELGNYYSRNMGKKGTAISMNKKRMVLYLLRFKDKLNVDENMVSKVLSHL